jgi:hypothetical protein
MYDGQPAGIHRDLRERTEPCSPMPLSGDVSPTGELHQLRPCVASAVDLTFYGHLQGGGLLLPAKRAW